MFSLACVDLPFLASWGVGGGGGVDGCTLYLLAQIHYISSTNLYGLEDVTGLPKDFLVQYCGHYFSSSHCKPGQNETRCEG